MCTGYHRKVLSPPLNYFIGDFRETRSCVLSLVPKVINIKNILTTSIFILVPSLVPAFRLSFVEYDFNFLRSTERTEFYTELS